MEKIKGLIKKIFTKKEIIFYGIFGVLATIINMGSFHVMTSTFHLEENFANIIAISLSVIFAYFTNRNLVFHSQAEEFGEKVVEFCKFILGRLFTMAFEYIGCFILFKYAPLQPIVSKLIITFFVIILNFIISKFFSFKKD